MPEENGSAEVMPAVRGTGGGQRTCLWSRLLISMLVLSTIVLAGCATTPSYQAKAGNRSDGAIVRGLNTGQFIFFTYTEFEKVDGLPLSIWHQVGGGWMVDPGLRVLTVSGTYVEAFGGRETGRVELHATLKAGHTYRIKAERKGNVMTFWLEDEETQEVISEKQSTNTTHWIQWL